MEFHVTEKKLLRKIHKNLCSIHGSATVDRSTVGAWARRVTAFETWKTELHALPCSVRPVTAVTPKMLHCADTIMYKDRYTGYGRNSELIINMNNILLRVLNDNFSTLQFTIVLKFVSHCFTFCLQCLLGGHHPPECTGAHELRNCT